MISVDYDFNTKLTNYEADLTNNRKSDFSANIEHNKKSIVKQVLPKPKSPTSTKTSNTTTCEAKLEVKNPTSAATCDEWNTVFPVKPREISGRF